MTGVAAPAVTDPPPAELAGMLERLGRDGLAHIPAKRPRDNILVATWNLREFGGLTERWLSAAGDVPKRDLFSVRCIAEILGRFDVIALQEVQRDIKALRHVLKILGEDWAFILTDVTEGDAGQNERLAFLFDTRRVQVSGLACELVVPEDVLERNRAVGEGALQRQFARTPYAVAFRSAGQTFILVTLHVVYGTRASQRTGELGRIADWLADWAARTEEYGQNLVCLGDFNIDRQRDANYQAFVRRGLTPAPELNAVPRTLPTADRKPKFYDQIAWFTDAGRARLTLGYEGTAGTVPWDDFLFTDLERGPKSFRISDHYPLWVEFLVPEPRPRRFARPGRPARGGSGSRGPPRP